jgi:hypothetical protein
MSEKTSNTRRTNLSPSALTFSWDNCHRCLWLEYNHQLRVPATMPLVGELAEMQESYFFSASGLAAGNPILTTSMHPDIPLGKVISHGGWVQSTPIKINGEDSHLDIRGKYDLLIEFENGTYGVIDCKMQANESNKSKFYSPQLEAYAYALENPVKGEPKQVSVLGIYAWSLDKPWGDVNHGFGYRVKSSWYPIDRNPLALEERLTNFIMMVNGDMPEAKSSCKQCSYISERDAIIRSQ